MGDLVAAAVVPIGYLQGIELDAKLGGEAIQKGLCLVIRVKSRSLSTPARLQAIHVVTVFVVDVDSIKVLAVDNAHETVRELLFLAKAVVPTVIVVARPAATHACTSKRKDDLLAHASPLVNQGLIVGIVAHGHRCSDVALSIALILGCIPHVRNSESHNQM